MDALARRRLLMLAPLGVAAAGSLVFWELLGRMRAGSYDPHLLDSVLIGRRLPRFALPGQPPSPGFSDTDILAAGKPTLINFFASWCVPCVEEVGVLMRLKQQGVTIWGIAYKDSVEATEGFLMRRGDPYGRVARDAEGRTAIDFGLYGVPETYVVDRSGIVRLRYAGALTDRAAEATILPMLRKPP